MSERSSITVISGSVDLACGKEQKSNMLTLTLYLVRLEILELTCKLILTQEGVDISL